MFETMMPSKMCSAFSALRRNLKPFTILHFNADKAFAKNGKCNGINCSSNYSLFALVYCLRNPACTSKLEISKARFSRPNRSAFFGISLFRQVELCLVGSLVQKCWKLVKDVHVSMALTVKSMKIDVDGCFTRFFRFYFAPDPVRLITDNGRCEISTSTLETTHRNHCFFLIPGNPR